MKPVHPTYTDFLHSGHHHSSFLSGENTEEIIQHFRPSQPSLSASAPVSFLVDYASKKYLYVQDSCFSMLGFPATYFLEMGLEEYLSRWHPADFHVMNTKVFPANLAFLSTISPEKYKEYIFSYNYRFKNAVGLYVTVLQRFSFIPHPTDALPQGVVGVIFDITHFKNDLSIVHTIESIKNLEHGTITELIKKDVYPSFDDVVLPLLTKREIEIVRFISKGWASKAIAAVLGVSVNTINNHRRNILVKTGAKSSSEVISYALKHGLF